MFLFLFLPKLFCKNFSGVRNCPRKELKFEQKLAKEINWVFVKGGELAPKKWKLFCKKLNQKCGTEEIGPENEIILSKIGLGNELRKLTGSAQQKKII